MAGRDNDRRERDPGRADSPSLKAAVRRTRIEIAAHSEAVDDLRRAEIARLELVEEALRAIIDQAPHSVDLFDLGIARGEKPRLFLDVIAFVDLGPDRRTYRFLQNTRYGRVLIAETASLERIVAAMTNYVARRLIEREQALASDWRGGGGAAEGQSAVRTEPRGEWSQTAQPRHRFAAFVDVAGFLLMALGAFTFFALCGLGAWLVLHD
jgi:hypothetical protein